MVDRDRNRWTKLIADFESSDLTQREFATEHGIPVSALRCWLYWLRKESRPLVEVAPERSVQVPSRGAAPEGSRLVSIQVIASAPKARSEAAAPAAGDGLLELVLASGSRMRFPPCTDLGLGYLRAIPAVRRGTIASRRTSHS